MRRLSMTVVAVVLVVLSACGDDASNEAEPAEDAAETEEGDTATGADAPEGLADGVESITIEVGDLTFDALAAGPEDGETVLLLHGFPQTSIAYEEQLVALADAGYRAVAPDQRGYSPGARPTEVEAYRIPELVGDVVGMADALGVDKFHLVGHDWGGMVAWHVAGREPDRLSSLTVLSTPHPEPYLAALGDPSDEQATMSSYINMLSAEGSEQALLDDDAALLRTVYEASGMPEGAEEPYMEALDTVEATAGAVNWYKAVDGSIADDELGPITAPTLYIWPTEDVALGRTAAEATADYVEGDYTFEELEGVSHWIPEEVPDELNTLLLGHLDANS
jgi:pimeloyl-ACP methyl ester carboxylesterase